MGECRSNQPKVKLFFALMTNQSNLFLDAERLLSAQYGAVDAISATYDFDPFTNYYASEFGEGLRKKIISVKPLIPPENLVDIKHRANELEFSLSGALNQDEMSPSRKINIDPGYLSLSKMILATTKDHAHRIYIGQGIFEEITLTYRKNQGFQPNPWTYPDYQAPERLDFFNQMRQTYMEQLKTEP